MCSTRGISMVKYKNMDIDLTRFIQDLHSSKKFLELKCFHSVYVATYALFLFHFTYSDHCDCNKRQ